MYVPETKSDLEIIPSAKLNVPITGVSTTSINSFSDMTSMFMRSESATEFAVLDKARTYSSTFLTVGFCVGLTVGVADGIWVG